LKTTVFSQTRLLCTKHSQRDGRNHRAKSCPDHFYGVFAILQQIIATANQAPTGFVFAGAQHINLTWFSMMYSSEKATSEAQNSYPTDMRMIS
jgi:hypothetical protein